MAGPQFLWYRRKGEAGVDFAVRKQLGRGWRLAGDPVDVVGRVEPDMPGHNRHEQMIARAEGGDADCPAFEVGNAVNALFPEQLEAADMDAGQHRDRAAAID